ncbi:protein EARLY RESPONSIVE TO DEHYDRATION 15-like [Oryza brachyantha]|uniref:Ataxin-2 C-terminal domain-containing protein n=1 Tax=Oryza brachyantha TaxID=4533 RepID=J3LNT8_ORYBR|nr:protein EARLY RESPONSIVE TO DEHYDRATION 15-like [Oryza brachyantha]XP_015690309.1 protein EARLY RESPONSIVE TO DEHYDRATION 15-like [Oryza brachyantha]
MSATAVSSLNPDAPVFIPAAFRQVEDFSPQWWDLVKTTAWFRDHWFHEHQQLDEMADSLELHGEDVDLAGLLPDDAFDDDEDFFYDQAQDLAFEPPHPPAAPKTDAVLKALSLVSPKAGDAARGFREKPRHSEKPTKYAGSPRSGGGAPRVIHQPR